MTDFVDVLIAARKLIEKPENWGKGFASSRPPHQLCLGQAISGAAQSLRENIAAAYMRFGEYVPYRGIPTWNDKPERTHADVLALIDKTIATERAKRGTEKLIDDALHSPTSEPPPVYTVERVW